MKVGELTKSAPTALGIVGVVSLFVLQNVTDGATPPWHDERASLWLDMAHDDGPNYLTIASSGYSYVPGEPSLVVWFPLYSLLIRPVTAVVSSPVLAGWMITVIAGITALHLFVRWCLQQGMEPKRAVAGLVLLAAYPYALYLYGPIYSDAVALSLAIGALYAMERDRRVLATVCGALATATRPTCLIIVVVLTIIAAQRDGVLRPWDPELSADRSRFARWLHLPSGVDLRQSRAATFLPLASASGVGLYSLYLWHRFGSPFVFLTNQRTFHGDWPILKADYIGRLSRFEENPWVALNLTLQGLLLVGAVLLIGAVARRFGFPYAILTLGAAAMPLLSTKNFMGGGRYLLIAFPVFALLGERLLDRGRTAVAAASALSAGMLATLAFGFVRGTYVG